MSNLYGKTIDRNMSDLDTNSAKINRDERSGTLYVVSTPIGNLEDITLRAINVLRKVDIIAAESVGHTRGLCQYHNIKTKLTRYNQHNQKTKAPELIRRLKSGQGVAVVTDAGTPGISDPGVYMIHLAAKEKIPVSPIPGPSAVIAALSVSGLPSEQFLFQGFLPNKSGKRKRALSELASETRTMVFFEAPHRIRVMLEDVKEVLGDRQMVMLREITKAFEDIKRGPVSEVLAHLTPDRVRGEFTLVVRGKEATRDKTLSRGLLDRIENLLKEEARSIRDIAALLSKEEGIAYREIYKECIAMKRNLEKGIVDGTDQDVHNSK